MVRPDRGACVSTLEFMYGFHQESLVLLQIVGEHSFQMTSQRFVIDSIGQYLRPFKKQEQNITLLKRGAKWGFSPFKGWFWGIMVFRTSVFLPLGTDIGQTDRRSATCSETLTTPTSFPNYVHPCSSFLDGMHSPQRIPCKLARPLHGEQPAG